MRALAPLIGYGIGAWATSIYVDLSGKSLLQKGSCDGLRDIHQRYHH